MFKTFLYFNVHFPLRKITKQNNFESNYQEKKCCEYVCSVGACVSV